VEEYHVTVTPDPSSCPQDVGPEEDYICSGLEQSVDYSITFSVTNCKVQEEGLTNYSFQIIGELD